ncbi:MAG: ferredoxin [Acidimicrobiia bacterium]
MAVRIVVDRRRCIGAGTCISLAPTAFQWRKGDFLKPEVLDLSTVDEDTLREIVIACPTQALVLEEVLDSLQS